MAPDVSVDSGILHFIQATPLTEKKSESKEFKQPISYMRDFRNPLLLCDVSIALGFQGGWRFRLCLFFFFIFTGKQNWEHNLVVSIVQLFYAFHNHIHFNGAGCLHRCMGFKWDVQI